MKDSSTLVYGAMRRWNNDERIRTVKAGRRDRLRETVIAGVGALECGAEEFGVCEVLMAWVVKALVFGWWSGSTTIHYRNRQASRNYGPTLREMIQPGSQIYIGVFNV